MVAGQNPSWAPLAARYLGVAGLAACVLSCGPPDRPRKGSTGDRPPLAAMPHGPLPGSEDDPRRREHLREVMAAADAEQSELDQAALRIMRAPELRSCVLNGKYADATRFIEGHPDYRKYGKKLKDVEAMLADLRAKMAEEQGGKRE